MRGLFRSPRRSGIYGSHVRRFVAGGAFGGAVVGLLFTYWQTEPANETILVIIAAWLWASIGACLGAVLGALAFRLWRRRFANPS